MTSALAFLQGAGDGQMGAWRQISDPPCLVRYGRQTFVQTPVGNGAAVRAYVNGTAIVGGLHLVGPGDLVRIIGAGGGEEAEVSYRIGEHLAVEIEDGQGRPCEFTGLPISGPAVRCGECGALIKQEVAARFGVCPRCDTRLDGAPADLPPEEEALQ